MKSYEETRFVFKCPKCHSHNEHSLVSIKKTNLQFCCAFEACCTRPYLLSARRLRDLRGRRACTFTGITCSLGKTLGTAVP